MEIKGFCDTLEKNRITCDRLQLIPSGTMPWMAPAGQIQHWTAEQCVKLFKIVKPVKISLNCEESDRIEAAQETDWYISMYFAFVSFQQKVDIRLNPDNVLITTPRLFSMYPKVTTDNRLGCIPLGPYNPGCKRC